MGSKQGEDDGGVKNFLIDVRRAPLKKGGLFHTQLKTGRGRTLDMDLDPEILAQLPTLPFIIRGVDA